MVTKLGPEGFSENELAGWGELIGRSIEPPLWIALLGPLGAGKSVLARAICRGAGIMGHIPSPSFTLVQRYDSPRGFEIIHVDLFRLSPGDRIEPLGWDELLDSPGIVLVEWADRSGDQQPEDRWEVRIDYADDPSKRDVTVARRGEAAELVAW